jgi:hypothetical protein
MRRHRHFVSVGIVVVVLLSTAVAAAAAHPGRSAPEQSTVAGSARHVDAVGYANQLLGRSPTTRSELLVRAAPVGRLLKTPLDISTSQVERREFWSSSDPVNATFAALKAQLTGRPVSTDGRPRRSREVDVEQHQLPATIAEADLVIRVFDTGNGHSAVAAYALVLARPPRPAVEHVPLAVDTVKLVDDKEALTGGAATRRVRIVHGLAARVLVGEFDALQAEPPGLNYAAVGSTQSITATFRTAGHRWQAGLGDPVSVTRDGHPLPGLQADSAFGRAMVRDSLCLQRLRLVRNRCIACLADGECVS